MSNIAPIFCTTGGFFCPCARVWRRRLFSLIRFYGIPRPREWRRWSNKPYKYVSRSCFFFSFFVCIDLHSMRCTVECIFETIIRLPRVLKSQFYRHFYWPNSIRSVIIKIIFFLAAAMLCLLAYSFEPEKVIRAVLMQEKVNCRHITYALFFLSLNILGHKHTHFSMVVFYCQFHQKDINTKMKRSVNKRHYVCTSHFSAPNSRKY